MKIILEHFGIINKFEFNTNSNFTFIIGKNNTGKSYAMIAIYSIVKNLSYLLEDFDELPNFIPDYEFLPEFEYSFIEFLENNIKEIINKGRFIEHLDESLKNNFDSLRNLENKLSNDSLKIKIIANQIEFSIKFDNTYLYVDETIVVRDVIRINTIDKFIDSKDFIKEMNLELLLEVKNLENIYYLPAFRSGLYQAMNSFGQIFAELSQKRRDTTKSITIPTMSEPVSDYYINLVSIKDDTSFKREDIDTESEEIDKITFEIEKNILNGKVFFNKDSKKLTFLPNNTRLNLDLSFTSSMVSEIVPIIAYLKYIIEKEGSSIIIIEEPEAHLHPEVQIELLKQLVELSKHNIRFIITTHSNYMFDQFNNLILSKDLDIDKTNCLLFKETYDGTKSINLEVNEYGVIDENFTQTFNKIHNEKLSIVDEMNEFEND